VIISGPADAGRRATLQHDWTIDAPSRRSLLSVELILSTVLITLALFFYTLGVWSERLARYLQSWHLIAFWTGFCFDLSGTYAMHRMAQAPFDILALHTLTGQIALWLMLAHASWATLVVRRGSETARRSFHRYSFIVWLVWLVPYFGGMIVAMRK
jgi:uncharacterized repeat protein (TIGR03987 family)